MHLIAPLYVLVRSWTTARAPVPRSSALTRSAASPRATASRTRSTRISTWRRSARSRTLHTRTRSRRSGPARSARLPVCPPAAAHTSASARTRQAGSARRAPSGDTSRSRRASRQCRARRTPASWCSSPTPTPSRDRQSLRAQRKPSPSYALSAFPLPYFRLHVYRLYFPQTFIQCVLFLRFRPCVLLPVKRVLYCILHSFRMVLRSVIDPISRYILVQRTRHIACNRDYR